MSLLLFSSFEETILVQNFASVLLLTRLLSIFYQIYDVHIVTGRYADDEKEVKLLELKGTLNFM